MALDEKLGAKPDAAPVAAASALAAEASPAPASAPDLPPFHRGEIVWAKLRGFPWWPAKVRAVRRAQAGEPPFTRVKFYYTNDNCVLPTEQARARAPLPAPPRRSLSKPAFVSAAQAAQPGRQVVQPDAWLVQVQGAPPRAPARVALVARE
jgi:hypothetical protein